MPRVLRDSRRGRRHRRINCTFPTSGVFVASSNSSSKTKASSRNLSADLTTQTVSPTTFSIRALATCDNLLAAPSKISKPQSPQLLPTSAMRESLRADSSPHDPGRARLTRSAADAVTGDPFVAAAGHASQRKTKRIRNREPRSSNRRASDANSDAKKKNKFHQ